MCILFFAMGRGVKTDIQRALIRFMITLCGWTCLDFILWNSAHLDSDLVLGLYRLQVPFYTMIGAYLFQFVYLMLGRDEDFWYKYVTWPAWFITIVGMFTGVMTKGHNPTAWGVIHEAGSWFVPGTFIGIFLPANASIVLLFFGVRNAANKAVRTQRLIVLVGVFFVCQVSVTTNIIIPWLIGHNTIIQLGSCTVTVLAIFVHVAIVGYDLLPISVEKTVHELFNRSEYGVVIVDQYSQIVEMNPAAEALLYHETALLRHSTVEELFGTSLNQTKSDQQFDHIVEIGSRKVYLKIEQTAYIEKHQFLGSIYTIKDVTVEKRAEEAILEANRILEERVVERTSELQASQQVLLEQKNELEKISRYKSEFIANLSHEIRTPLNGIVGFSEVIAMDQNLSRQHREQIKHIKKCTDMLLDLINSILDYSKIEANKMVLNRSLIDVSELMEQSALNCRMKLDEMDSPVEIIVDNSALKNKYYVDSLRLEQVLNNLVSNATKFTKEGYIKVEAELVRQFEKEDVLRFSVTDTGKGVSEEEGQRIFDVFEQGDGSSTRRYGGTGLGLSISKQLVNLMGGKLELTHYGVIDGIGACFTFDLSLERAEKIELNNFKNDVLVYVDSNKEATYAFTNNLSKFGAEVLCFNSLESFEQDCSGKMTSLIIEESCLRGKIGERVSKKYLADNSVYFVVAFRSHQESIQYRIDALKADKFLCKPIIPSELKSVFEDENILEIECLEDEEVTEKIKILMAEDNELNQLMQKTILEKLGYEVTIAENGQIACDFIQKDEYDILLMDMQMPVLCGADATVKIREMGYKLPIIAMTANAYEEDRRICIDAGMDSFLTKPLDVDKLIEEIKKFL